MSLLTRTDQKFLSFALSSLWKLIPGLAGLSCKIERRRLDGLLLVAGQAGEAVGEGVGDAEFHIAIPRILHFGTRLVGQFH